jgi:polyhydroxyalkanoate synthesis regulator phasin
VPSHLTYLFDYLVEVGNIDTTEPTRVVDEMLATEMYPEDNKSVVRVSFAQ